MEPKGSLHVLAENVFTKIPETQYTFDGQPKLLLVISKGNSCVKQERREAFYTSCIFSGTSIMSTMMSRSAPLRIGVLMERRDTVNADKHSCFSHFLLFPVTTALILFQSVYNTLKPHEWYWHDRKQHDNGIIAGSKKEITRFQVKRTPETTLCHH